MTRAAFLNRVRSLNSIDRDRLPELSQDEWREFRNSPVDFFIFADDFLADAIWREVEKRQAARNSTDIEPTDAMLDAGMEYSMVLDRDAVRGLWLAMAEVSICEVEKRQAVTS